MQKKVPISLEVLDDTFRRERQEEFPNKEKTKKIKYGKDDLKTSDYWTSGSPIFYDMRNEIKIDVDWNKVVDKRRSIEERIEPSKKRRRSKRVGIVLIEIGD